MAKTKTFEVSLTVVPTDGKSSTKKVKVPVKASLADVLESAGVASTKKDFLVNGKPAALDTVVTPDAKVTVTERPQGS